MSSAGITYDWSSNMMCTSRGTQCILGAREELVTIRAAATTESTKELVPGSAVIDCISIRVHVAADTATEFEVGIPGTADKFGTIPNTVGTYNLPAAQPVLASSTVLLTPDASPLTAVGSLSICVMYRQFGGGPADYPKFGNVLV